jgi:UDP-N-acetylglucosamine 4,6-dehydratase/5-epimerase
MLKGKSFLITGGTGSFGHTLVNKLLGTDIREVVVFSRDEAKQHFMRQEISDPRLRFILGDIRNYESVLRALYGVDYIFHAAALKQVPASEAFPWEFVQTNVKGSHNLLRAITNSNVTNSVFLSTDKAVYPLNAMGMTKALMEKLVRSDDYSSNSISVITRYSHVTITDPIMTRFMMSLDESVDLVLFALANGSDGDLFVQKSPAATVETIVGALSLLLKQAHVEMKIIGVRPGEKIHETLLTAEERSLAIEHERYFQVKKRTHHNDLLAFKGQSEQLEYTSANTEILSVEQLSELLMKIPMVASAIRQ